MNVTIALAQSCHPADGNVIALVERFAAEAQAEGADLLVFPESLMSRYEAEIGDFLAESQPLDGPFTQAVDAIAARFGLWIVYTMNERNDLEREGETSTSHACIDNKLNVHADAASNTNLDVDARGSADTEANASAHGNTSANSNGDTDANVKHGLPFNTAIVTDNTGVRRGFYRKIHLFDSATTTESERMAASDRLFSPIDTPFGKLGLAICYDLRFPEVARAAALEGCDIMVYPAAWVDGPGKALQWETLLAARAIENEMFVVGVSRADEGYVGNSVVIGPDGTVHVRGDREERLLVAHIDTDDLARMRAAIPVFDHRRPDAY